MTPSQLKHHVESQNSPSYFFTRPTMRFFGDSMRNYGVRTATVDNVPVWELYRKRAVLYGLQDSVYFTKNNYQRIWSAS